ncbi:mannan endo-1,4-beta-mannosidase 4-like [Impatiens glandulifera]|uniref:mannan endo-1,4-beta-mannosidase 4-like n=1 Tax=Impatiens glandulifera TaxID=253017 RepID=UPI001FB161FA|nr:mannan endo-1,4-beta-mannosidase 4-like [Impatiens glandulifera]
MTQNNFLSLVLALVFYQVGFCFGEEFIKTNGTHFTLNGEKLYLNGFNAYWMMYTATDQTTRPNVESAFHQASINGMNVARTWAFSDGGYRPLQSAPGIYNEDTFKGLDFVISEASKYGVHLILSLVNNWDDFGGKKQYVEWGKESGRSISNVDEFFTDQVVRQYYKNHIETILMRKNSINGITYKDDPTIMAWELMNEPRCPSDLSGKTFQDWIIEMSNYVKSIDKNHLLEVGLEGFYNKTMQSKQFSNPSLLVGTDFISNNQVPAIDFATIHLYPNIWSPAIDEYVFVEQWIRNHIQDSNSIIEKPILLTEFGKSSRMSGFNVSVRDEYFGKVYDMLYDSAKNGESCAGGLFWQLLVSGLDNFRDGNEVILDQDNSTAMLILSQSNRIYALN